VASRLALRRLATLAVVLTGVQACDGDEARPSPTALDDNAVTIGSFNFPESELLAEVYGQALESAGVEVHRATRLGPREFVGPALARGLVEFVPEYTGTALQFLTLGAETATASPPATHTALVEALRQRPIVALDAAPGQNANAVVVTQETAARHDLETISDLAAVAPTLTFGGPPECPSRPLCLLGLREVYGLEFDTFVGLEVGTPLIRQALERGDIDVALMFTTNPEADAFVVLRDDRGLQPAENIVPLVRSEVVERWDQVATIADQVSAQLTTDVLRELNREMARGETAADVAAAWLAEQVPQ
jgi:osmoprotectant transport system substrate-binding protein